MTALLTVHARSEDISARLLRRRMQDDYATRKQRFHVDNCTLIIWILSFTVCLPPCCGSTFKFELDDVSNCGVESGRPISWGGLGS